MGQFEENRPGSALAPSRISSPAGSHPRTVWDVRVVAATNEDLAAVVQA